MSKEVKVAPTEDIEKQDEKTGEEAEQKIEDVAIKQDGEAKDATKEEEKKVEDAAEEKAKDGEKPPIEETEKDKEVVFQDNELSQNREILRQQKFENDILVEQNTGLRNLLKEKGLLTEDEAKALEDVGTKENAEESKAISARQDQLNILLETMVEGRHPDIRKYVTGEVVQRLVADIAQDYAKSVDEDVDVLELREQVEHALWFKKTNPWSFIKEQVIDRGYFRKEDAKAKVNEQKSSASAAKDVLKMVKGPTSLASVPGGGDTSGWTKTKIDALPEAALNDVPEKIYDAYLRGELG